MVGAGLAPALCLSPFAPLILRCVVSLVLLPWLVTLSGAKGLCAHPHRPFAPLILSAAKDDRALAFGFP